jgi:hypothetical protein
MQRQVNRGVVMVWCVRVPPPMDVADQSSVTLSL